LEKAQSRGAPKLEQTTGFSSQENNMPTIRVDLFEGRTAEQKRNFVKALTQACVDTLGSKPDSVDVILFDVKPSDWATGGELWSEKKKQG
jgi:4-oxalocrotonate tautomerase